MESLTITEALSELNLIKKKVEKKKGAIIANLVRPKHLPDPLASQGGSEAFVKSEMQSVYDLNARFIRIKGAIAKANTDTKITIGGFEKSIHDWLVWKRDIAKMQFDLETEIYRTVKNHFDRLGSQPQVYKTDSGETKLLEYEANADYAEYLKKAEAAQDTLEKLDGQLSLKNATVVVNF